MATQTASVSVRPESGSEPPLTRQATARPPDPPGLLSPLHEQTPEDPDHPEFSMLGYKFYAGLVGAIVGSLLILLYRFGLFAALT